MIVCVDSFVQLTSPGTEQTKCNKYAPVKHRQLWEKTEERKLILAATHSAKHFNIAGISWPMLSRTLVLRDVHKRCVGVRWGRKLHGQIRLQNAVLNKVNQLSLLQDFSEPLICYETLWQLKREKLNSVFPNLFDHRILFKETTINITGW